MTWLMSCIKCALKEGWQIMADYKKVLDAMDVITVAFAGQKFSDIILIGTEAMSEEQKQQYTETLINVIAPAMKSSIDVFADNIKNSFNMEDIKKNV